MDSPPIRRPSGLVPRIVITLAVGAAAAGFLYVCTAPSTNNAPARPPEVESVFPQHGNLELRQTAIYADLAPGYTGYLMLDGKEVVDDDIQFVDAVNTVTLKPQADSDFAELQPGRHCATVVYRRIGQPKPESNSHTWCFRLH